MDKIKVRVFGCEQTFTPENLSAILEEYYEIKGTARKEHEIPMMGRWYRVYPALINQKLFQEKRENRYQEEFRRRILDVFERFKYQPDLLKPFKLMVPSFEGGAHTRDGLQEIARKYGERVADFDEQELEWAQRICNGESWEKVCNSPEPRGRSYYTLSGNFHYLVGVRKENGTYKDIMPFSTNDLYNGNNNKPLVISYEL